MTPLERLEKAISGLESTLEELYALKSELSGAPEQPESKPEQDFAVDDIMKDIAGEK